MARKDALLRLHQRLVARRDSLRKKLYNDFQEDQDNRSRGGDVGDTAHSGSESEIDTQLASLESRELTQIERAIDKLCQGRYGICEGCEQGIPVARLNALPYTPFCVNCQREMEESGRRADRDEADWEKAYRYEGQMSDREYTIRELDVD